MKEPNLAQVRSYVNDSITISKVIRQEVTALHRPTEDVENEIKRVTQIYCAHVTAEAVDNFSRTWMRFK